MDWVHLFAGIDGRINRKPFWIGLLVLAVPEIAAHVLLGERWSAIVSLLIAYPQFALFAKRGHDRNVPTWVPGVFMAGAVVLSLMTLAGLSGSMDKPSPALLAVGIPVALMGLVLLIDFGLRRGVAGDNRYGPDPLAGQGTSPAP